nr:hypothetical protein [Planomonospora sp. ID67723]
MRADGQDSSVLDENGCQAGQGGVHPGQVEGGGVEAEPFQTILVLFMLGIGEDLQETVVAPDATAVFRRTGSPAGEAARIDDPRTRVSGSS